MYFRVRGYEPRGWEFESLRARQINGISNDTNSVLSQVNRQNLDLSRHRSPIGERNTGEGCVYQGCYLLLAWSDSCLS